MSVAAPGRMLTLRERHRGVLAGGASEAYQQARLSCTVGGGVAPELPSKRNVELIGNGGRTATTRQVSRLANTTAALRSTPGLEHCVEHPVVGDANRRVGLHRFPLAILLV